MGPETIARWEDGVAAIDDLNARSYYDVLGIDDHGADADTIKAAYYALVMIAHPDRHAREAVAERKHAIVLLYARISEAYRVLSVPATRTQYDQQLAAGKTRLGHEAAKPALVDNRDPSTAKARELYDQAMRLIEEGEPAKARSKLDLARQFEPESKAIGAALERVRSELTARLPPLQPLSPAALPASALPLSQPRPPPRNQRRSPARKSAVKPAGAALRPLELRCSSWDQFRLLYHRSIRRGGLLLPTTTPPKLGTRLTVALLLPDDHSFRLTTEVARVAEPRSEGERARVSLRIIDLDEHRAALEALLRSQGAPPDQQPPTTPPAASDPPAPPPPAPEPPTDPNDAGPDPIRAELEQELQRMRGSSAHDVLEVATDASSNAIRKTYIAAVKRTHPDLYGFASAAAQEVAGELFYLVHRAYDELRRSPRRPSPAPLVSSAPPAAVAPAASPAPAPSVAAAPDSTTTILRAAQAALRQADYDQACAHLDRAIDADPNDNYIRAAYHVAAGHQARRQGKADESRQNFEAALLFDEECAEALAQLRTPGEDDSLRASVFNRIFPEG